MNVSARSYLTAGAAALSATAIVMAPVQPLNSDLAAAGHKSVSDLAVGLAAAVTPVDPIQNIIDVVDNSSVNLITLVNDWAAGLYVNGTFPFPPNTGTVPIFENGNLGWRTGGYASGAALPILSQVITNLETYLGELPDIGTILGQVFSNIGNALGAPFQAGAEESGRPFNSAILPVSPYNQNVNAVPYFDVPLLGAASQRDLWALLPTVAGEEAYASLKPILDFLSTPVSGVLVGAIGPIVAPVLAVVNSISNTIELLRESNFGGALTELINIPANVIGAVLNGGQTLDLTPVLSLLGVTLPDSIQSIGLKMGGLLSPGGVGFDALAAVAEVPDVLSLDIPGLPLGPIGALAGLNSYVAKSMNPLLGEAPAAAAEAPAVEAVEVAAPAAAPDSAPEVAAVAVSEPAEAPAEAADPVSEPAQQVADDVDTAPAAPRASRAARGAGASSSDDGAGASTPKRAARGAASRG